jgi:hypothetical protein
LGQIFAIFIRGVPPKTDISIHRFPVGSNHDFVCRRALGQLFFVPNTEQGGMARLRKPRFRTTDFCVPIEHSTHSIAVSDEFTDARVLSADGPGLSEVGW